MIAQEILLTVPINVSVETGPTGYSAAVTVRGKHKGKKWLNSIET